MGASFANGTATVFVNCTRDTASDIAITVVAPSAHTAADFAFA